MADETDSGPIPTLEDWQHWTWVMGRAQQLLMEAWADSLKTAQPWPTSPPAWGAFPPAFFAAPESTTDPMSMLSAGAENWAKGLQAWGDMLGLGAKSEERKDRRFSAPEWRENPLFDQIRQTYLALSDKLLGTVDEIDGVDGETRAKLKFATQNFVDAMSPSNFALTNPQVL